MRCISCRRIAESWWSRRLPQGAAAMRTRLHAVLGGVFQECVDACSLRGPDDEDRIGLGGLDAPLELDAESTARARDECDVLLLASQLDEAVGDRCLDALSVVSGAPAVEDRAHSVHAGAGRARVLTELVALISSPEHIA